jgi:prepilin-type N-terminal cleavage/methylation domain-containing protein
MKRNYITLHRLAFTLVELLVVIAMGALGFGGAAPAA